MHDIILKIFNIQFSPENYNNKAKSILKDYPDLFYQDNKEFDKTLNGIVKK